MLHDEVWELAQAFSASKGGGAKQPPPTGNTCCLRSRLRSFISSTAETLDPALVESLPQRPCVSPSYCHPCPLSYLDVAAMKRICSRCCNKVSVMLWALLYIQQHPEMVRPMENIIPMVPAVFEHCYVVFRDTGHYAQMWFQHAKTLQHILMAASWVIWESWECHLPWFATNQGHKSWTHCLAFLLTISSGQNKCWRSLFNL